MHRLDDVLRGIALAFWVAAGAPSWTRLLDARAEVGGGHWVVWCVLYVAFAAAMIVATSSRRSVGTRRVLVAFQSLAAVALVALGMPHVEGTAFAIVAWQTPSIVRPAAALVWDTAQACALYVMILSSHGPGGAAKATGEYAAFAVVALVFVRLRETEAAARDALKRANAELHATRRLLAEDARANERLRIAREVHDAIGHGLTAASMHLQVAARSERPAEPVAAAQQAVRATLADVRSLVRVLRDEAPMDLAASLRTLVSGVRDPQVELVVPEPLDVADSQLAHVLFRFVQEGLTNVVRHACAQRCWIEIARTPGAITAVIRDDGVGASTAVKGVGLRGLCERVEEIGGTVAFESEPRRGSTLSARLACADAAA